MWRRVAFVADLDGLALLWFVGGTQEAGAIGVCHSLAGSELESGVLAVAIERDRASLALKFGLPVDRHAAGVILADRDGASFLNDWGPVWIVPVNFGGHRAVICIRFLIEEFNVSQVSTAFAVPKVVLRTTLDLGFVPADKQSAVMGKFPASTFGDLFTGLGAKHMVENLVGIVNRFGTTLVEGEHVAKHRFAVVHQIAGVFGFVRFPGKRLFSVQAGKG